MTNVIEKKAKAFCDKNRHRLTVPRLNVLTIIFNNKGPIKAYEVLEKLSLVLKNPAPPTVYRAIDFWEKHNFIHRIESLNAYSICEVGHLHSGSQYMICNDCGSVIESHLSKLPLAIKQAIQKKMFILKKWNLEISGICNRCS